MRRTKYPRTRHLPWSAGATPDDLVAEGLEGFVGQQVVVTEKMDGENTSLYADHLHARSVDGRHHPSRDWVKGLHGRIAHQIPAGWRLCGENLFAQHSIAYAALPSYFMLFSVWDDDNRCVSWADTRAWAERLQLQRVPTLYEGVFDEAMLRELKPDTHTSEGYVVRLASSFAYEAFGRSVAKWVRAGHVRSEDHWMHQPIVPNRLATESTS